MVMRELGYSRRVVESLNEMDRASLESVIGLAESLGIAVDFQPIGGSLFKIMDDGRCSGYFAPSLLSSYFYCARRLWLELRHGKIVDVEGLKRVLRGKIAEKLWLREHPGFEPEVEVWDEILRVHGYVDALKVSGRGVILVELKTAHRPNLGHRLQTMLYKVVVEKLYKVGVEAYLVYRHGVVAIGLDRGLLERYMRRVRAVLESSIPPPLHPEKKYCNTCPLIGFCKKYPLVDWDEWLVGVVGDYPKSREECEKCSYLYICRSFKARNGKPPCESPQASITAFKAVEEILRA